MKRLGGSDSFTGSIIMRILLILLARISVGLEEKDITGKASGENNIQFFMPINNAKNSGFLNHVAQDWMGNQGHSVCSSEWHSSQRFVISTKRKKLKKMSLCYASWRTFLKQLGELWRMEGKRVGANKEYNFLLFP